MVLQPLSPIKATMPNNSDLAFTFLVLIAKNIKNRHLSLVTTKIVKNAKALADALISEGFNILTGGTDNHLMLLDLRGTGVTGKELQNKCDEVYITLNKNTVPNDPESPFTTSGVRIGTPAVTSRGLVEEDMKTIARLIRMAAFEFDAKADEIRAEVTKLMDKYPIYK